MSLEAREIRLPRERSLRFGSVPLVMAIINVTPDSFSDGGRNLDPAEAIENGLRAVEEGAAIIDVGGESTRPGAEPVPLEEELSRVVPVIRGIRDRSEVAISIDTRRLEVAEAGYDAGADVINDVSALRFDRRMARFAAETGLPVILMHMRGEPRTMQLEARYDDVASEVERELGERKQEAMAAGIAEDAILVDPGIGFAKNLEHNLALLAGIDRLARLAPVVVGASRKSFIGALTGQTAARARMAGSLAAVAAAAEGGAAVVRVHDVRETVDFLTVLGAITGKR